MAKKNHTRYEYKISLGKHPITGELIRKSFYSTKSKADAKRKAEAYRLKYELELCVTGNGVIKSEKFSDWALKSLEIYKKPYVKANTYSGTYLIPVQKHLIPYFGNMHLNEITNAHIQSYLNKANKKYSAETVRKDFNCLTLIFNTAVDNQLCPKSPVTKSIKLPKLVANAEKEAYTQEQYDAVYEMAAGDDNALALLLLLETGISRSELLGLRWQDINTKNRCIHIRQGLVTCYDESQDKNTLVHEGLKNMYRRRDIPILADKLWKLLITAPRTITVGERPVITQTVIHSPTGEVYNPDNWSKRVFAPFMHRVHQAHPDIPVLTPHELRHIRKTPDFMRNQAFFVVETCRFELQTSRV